MSYLDDIQYLIYKKNVKVILENFKVIIFKNDSPHKFVRFFKPIFNLYCANQFQYFII